MRIDGYVHQVCTISGLGRSPGTLRIGLAVSTREVPTDGAPRRPAPAGAEAGGVRREDGPVLTAEGLVVLIRRFSSSVGTRGPAGCSVLWRVALMLLRANKKRYDADDDYR